MLAYFYQYYLPNSTWYIMLTGTKFQINWNFFTERHSSESNKICPALITLITRILGKKLKQKTSSSSSKITNKKEEERKRKPAVTDDLSVCVLDLLREVSTYPSLVAMILLALVIQIFQIATWPHIGHVVKESCGFRVRATPVSPSLVWCL